MNDQHSKERARNEANGIRKQAEDDLNVVTKQIIKSEVLWEKQDFLNHFHESSKRNL